MATYRAFIFNGLPTYKNGHKIKINSSGSTLLSGGVRCNACTAELQWLGVPLKINSTLTHIATYKSVIWQVSFILNLLFSVGSKMTWSEHLGVKAFQIVVNPKPVFCFCHIKYIGLGVIVTKKSLSGLHVAHGILGQLW